MSAGTNIMWAANKTLFENMVITFQCVLGKGCCCWLSLVGQAAGNLRWSQRLISWLMLIRQQVLSRRHLSHTVCIISKDSLVDPNIWIVRIFQQLGFILTASITPLMEGICWLPDLRHLTSLTLVAGNSWMRVVIHRGAGDQVMVLLQMVSVTRP